MLSETRADELVRDALVAQADRAVDAADALAGLDLARTARTRRNRTLSVAAVAAAVVVAMAIPIGLHLGRTPATPPAAGPWVRTPYHPTWVPSGYVADDRWANLDGSQYLQRWAQGQFNFVSFTANTNAPDQPCAVSTTEPVSVNGVTGEVVVCTPVGAYVGQASGTIQPLWTVQVRWSPEPGWHLAVGMTHPQHPDAVADKTTVLRVARSVVVDPSVRLDVALTVHHVPSGIVFHRGVDVYESPSSPGLWSVQVGAQPPGQLPGSGRTDLSLSVPYLEVFWGPAVTVPQGQSPAGWCDMAGCTSFVKLQGWWLEARVQYWTPPPHLNVTLRQAADLAHGVTVNPGFDYSWLGRS